MMFSFFRSMLAAAAVATYAQANDLTRDQYMQMAEAVAESELA